MLLCRYFVKTPKSVFSSTGDYNDLTGTQKIATILLELKRSNTRFVLFWVAVWILLELQKISTILLELKRFHNFTGPQKIKPKCFVLSLCIAVSLVDFVSRDVSNWLFRLFWTLFTEMFPTGYFVSSGPCFQRCFQLVISSLLEITTILLELKRLPQFYWNSKDQLIVLCSSEKQVFSSVLEVDRYFHLS